VILAGIIACFTLSGFAALLYQVAWLRQLSTVFGTSDLAVATILAAYMGGLALGAAVAGRFVHRVTRPVLTYGILEAGIAVSALCVPLLMRAAASLYQFIFGNQLQPVADAGFLQPAYYLISTVVIIAIPTGLMGATLPILIKHAVARNSQIGPRTGLLYAMNTFGAVAGTVAAAFLLLPAFGLQKTIWFGVLMNAIVFLIAAAMSRSLKTTVGVTSPASRPIVSIQKSFWILPIVSMSGAIAFFYEVLWTRLLTHVIGGSIHAFATMLASFLAGIAIGGGLAGYLASSRERAALLFSGAQIAIAGLSAIVYYSLQYVSPYSGGLAANAGLAVLTMLPATIFIGATFPLAVRVLAIDQHGAGHASARVFAWNTGGAIAGAVGAGFFLIHALGFSGSIRLAVALNLSLALLCLVLVTSVRGKNVAALAACLTIAIVLYHPSRPDAVITASSVINSGAGKETFYAVGRSATVLVLENDDGFYVRSNGLPEATITRRGAPPTLLTQSWLTALPIIARPEADSLLLIGLGGGVAIENLPPSVESIDVIELEPEVVSANRALAEFRQRDPLADARVSLTINDARNALLLTNKQYGIIVSQPSHPWTAGASHLYTREFMQLASEHLGPDGVFVQWMSIEFVDVFLLRSLATTLTNVFEHVRLYRPSPDVLIFLASAATLDVEQTLLPGGSGRIPKNFAQLGVNSLEDLLAALVLDSEGVTSLSAGAPDNNDDMNRLATSRLTLNSLSVTELDTLLHESDPLLDSRHVLRGAAANQVGLVYVGYKLLRTGFRDRALRLAGVLDRSNGFLLLGLSAMLDGNSDESDRLLQKALAENSTNDQARYALLRNHLANLARGSAGTYLSDIAHALPPSAAATVSGWRHALNRDWSSLSDLDSVLAQAKTTDLWFVEAARLRAEWRLRNGPSGAESLQYALDIVDRSLALYELEELYLLRAAIAARLENPFVFVETATAVIGKMRTRTTEDPTTQDLQRIIALAEWFAERLGRDFVSPVADRASAVRERFAKLADDVREQL